MKRFIKLYLTIITICVFTIPLFACSEINYNKTDFSLNLEIGSEDFKILQLTDIQISTNSQLPQTLNYINQTITASNPDFIILTGDQFEGGEVSKSVQRTIIDAIFKCIDDYNKPWSFVFGNHDDEGRHKKFEIVDIAKTYPNCYFLTGEINLSGNGNFVINLTDDGVSRYALIMMDSNKYRTYFPFTSGYDYIHENQIDWYEYAVKDLAKTKFGDYNKGLNHIVPNIMFFHIPLPEFQTAFDKFSKGELSGTGTNNESTASPKQNTGLFDKAVELGSTKGIFVGHDHLNYSTILYQDVYLGYGVKSSTNSYHDSSILGGSEIIINADNSLSFNRIFI